MTENNLVTGVKPSQCFTKKRRPRRRSSWNLPATHASARACTKSSVARRLKSVGTRRVRVAFTVNRCVIMWGLFSLSIMLSCKPVRDALCTREYSKEVVTHISFDPSWERERESISNWIERCGPSAPYITAVIVVFSLSSSLVSVFYIEIYYKYFYLSCCKIFVCVFYFLLFCFFNPTAQLPNTLCQKRVIETSQKRSLLYFLRERVVCASNKQNVGTREEIRRWCRILWRYHVSVAKHEDSEHHHWL